ncbi:hypothetical protein JZ751_005181 [Albula glossodonta]|uniref:Centrosomal protein 57kDa-like protein 1 n=1 Tax=Albula glossodonta TaxID=121402 RepID=A0A8T2P6V6_9TELE|nr:hypothetical protein JZ751_005181 [Albula glossodonta]
MNADECGDYINSPDALINDLTSVSLGSPFRNSYVGSFHLPPERKSPQFVNGPPVSPVPNNVHLQEFNAQMYQTTPDCGSKAVITALKTLQEKMRRLELERAQAERNLQSAESRCSLLEKQLDYMKKMMEKAEQDKNALVPKQASLQKERQKDQVEVNMQLQKLEMLERECLKLSSTQSVAERKIELLEQKLREEEHERKLVQEKAAELQRSLEMSSALYSSVSAEVKHKKKTKILVRKTAAVVPAPMHLPKVKQMPFVAGTSTGPSHSVSANVQSVLHMMKHHHPQLCDRIRSLRRSGSETRRGPRRAVSSNQTAPVLSNLSELLLALQDELGQMSFEHKELVQQIAETKKPELREDLERELDHLVQKLKHKSSEPRRAASADGRIGATSKTKSLLSSPAQKTPRAPKGKGSQGTQSQQQQSKGPVRLQTNLKKDDIMWET